MVGVNSLLILRRNPRRRKQGLSCMDVLLVPTPYLLCQTGWQYPACFTSLRSRHRMTLLLATVDASVALG